jgi:ATP-binding cassette subfamily B protein
MAEFKEQNYNKKVDLRLWKKLIRYGKAYKKDAILLAIVMFGVAGIDAALPLLTKYVIDYIIIPKELDKLGLFSAAYGVLILIQSVNVYFLIAIAGKIEMGLNYEIRKDGFKKLQELSFSYYDKTPTGWIMARMTSDIEKLSSTISWGLVDMIWANSMMAIIAVVMLIANFKLGLMTLAVIPILIIVSIYFQKKILKSYRKVRKTNSKITGAFSEGIMGAKTTKTLVLEDSHLNSFESLTSKMKNSSVRAAIFSSLYLPVVLILGSIGTALVMTYGGYEMSVGTLMPGTLILFINYTVLFFDPIQDLARIFAELQNSQASAERILSLIETESDIKDRISLESYGDELPTIKGNVCFDHVDFHYVEEESVLKDFSLNVNAGETIALVGETGSGKSTIVNLVCRFYEATSGTLSIDGIDIRDIPQKWLHSNIGYVLQSPHLFSGTIRDNILYSNPDASELEMIRAAKMVKAHSFISKLENGYDTEVGEGGSRLSTGQKQLISFARAILCDPALFILDEATSSIDTETEVLIQKAIDEVLHGRTSFIVAHRLSTIRNADRILVLKNGSIVEIGSHKELLNKKGAYYSLYKKQFSDEYNINTSIKN